MYTDNSRANVAVIGSGIAGCLSAWLLARSGHSVTLIDETPRPFQGTSAAAEQCHLGGMYSASPLTARHCLESAIEYKRDLPQGLRSQRLSFLVADGGELSMDDFVTFYSWLREEYAS